MLDVPAEMAALTTNVLTTTMFSDSLTETEVHESRHDLDTIMDSVLIRMLMAGPLKKLPIPANRRFERARARTRRRVLDIVATRRAEGGDRGDLLSALLSAHDTESSGAHQVLSDDEIANQMMTFYIAGIESIAITMTWALHLVAAHPDIERRLHEEVDTVLAGRTTATHDDLPRLELTNRIITETLRIRAPVWLLTRKVTTDTRLGGHHLPAGTTVAYSPYLIHHRADLYHEPERFDPDRWDPALHQPPSRTAYLPFTNGARKCIGDKLGIIEGVLALATIAANWRLTHLPGETVRPAASFAMKPHRLRMRTTRRGPLRGRGLRDTHG